MKRFILSALIILLLAGTAFAAIPKTINFQGRLIKSDGTPITGVQPITVGLYKSPTGLSDNVWIDTFNTTVCDSQGVFNILLGSGLPLDVDFNQTLWVQITYIGETFSPRQPLCASPFAFMAISAEAATNANYATLSGTSTNLADNGISIMPIGSILPFAGTTVPSNYLACNGQSLTPISSYQKLYDVIGTTYGGSGNSFNVPDYRGYFLRGWDAGTGRDPNKTTRTGGDPTLKVGSTQESAFQAHDHWVHGWQGQGASEIPAGAATSGWFPRQYTTAGATLESSGTYGLPKIAAETRPLNIYVMYIIRYK